MAVAITSRIAGTQTIRLYPTVFERELHEWEHDFNEQTGRQATAAERSLRGKRLFSELRKTGEIREPYECPRCDFGTIEIIPRTYVEMKTETGVTVYVSLDGSVSLAVLTEEQCLERLQGRTDKEQYLNELRAWCNRQRDRLHADWAKACLGMMLATWLKHKKYLSNDQPLTLDDIFA